MNIPGFSAEASLCESYMHYRAGVFLPCNEQVIPQVRNDCLRRAFQRHVRCVNEGILGHGLCDSLLGLGLGICDVTE